MTIARSIARPIASRIASRTTAIGGGGSPAPSLDILASVGTSTSPTSVGTKAVTGVGFQPKVVLPFSAHAASIGSSTTGSMNIGVATSSVQSAVSCISSNGVTTSATYRRHHNSRVFSQSGADGSSTVTQASRSSLDADGFTLNFDTVFDARLFNHIALGGADLEVSLTQHQMNGTNAAQSFAHGLTGGAPTGLIAFSMAVSTAPPVTEVIAHLQFGVWSATQQANISVISTNGVTTTVAKRALFSDRIVGSYFSAGTGTYGRSLAVSSVDATNVNATYVNTADTTQRYFWLLAIRGAKCQVGTFNTANSLSPLTIATTGITPKLFLPIFIPSGVSSIGTVLNDSLMTIGASDGTSNVSCGISDANAVTTTNARRSQSSTTLCEYNAAGTKSFEGTAAFSGESVVITPTTVAANFGQGSWLVIGS